VTQLNYEIKFRNLKNASIVVSISNVNYYGRLQLQLIRKFILSYMFLNDRSTVVFSIQTKDNETRRNICLMTNMNVQQSMCFFLSRIYSMQSTKAETVMRRFEKCLCFTLASLNYYEDLLHKFSILIVYFPLASGGNDT
jgi:hypothetical protein